MSARGGVCSGDVCLGVSAQLGCTLPCKMATDTGGTHRTGMHSCFIWSRRQTPPPSSHTHTHTHTQNRVNRRVVRILMECMLVLHGIYLVQESLPDFLEIRISRFQERRAAKRTRDYLYEIWFSATFSIATPCAKDLFSLVYSCLKYPWVLLLRFSRGVHHQWRIHYFPEEGRQPPGGANIRICRNFPKTAWNRKNLDVRGGACPSRTPPPPPKKNPPIITFDVPFYTVSNVSNDSKYTTKWYIHALVQLKVCLHLTSFSPFFV